MKDPQIPPLKELVNQAIRKMPKKGIISAAAFQRTLMIDYVTAVEVMNEIIKLGLVYDVQEYCKDGDHNVLARINKQNLAKHPAIFN